jgi:hypothetical protein
MQIIIEFKNPQILIRLLELLRITEWLGGVKVWKKNSEHSPQELIYDFTPASPTPNGSADIDYRNFYGIIQPPMSLETIDRLIAEMREE